jgi:hypothetical protein
VTAFGVVSLTLPHGRGCLCFVVATIRASSSSSSSSSSPSPPSLSLPQPLLLVLQTPPHTVKTMASSSSSSSSLPPAVARDKSPLKLIPRRRLKEMKIEEEEEGLNKHKKEKRQSKRVSSRQVGFTERVFEAKGVLKPPPKIAFAKGYSKAMGVLKPLPKTAFAKRCSKVERNRCNQPGWLEEHESETIRLAEFILTGAQQRRDWKKEHEQKGRPRLPIAEPPLHLLPLPNFVAVASDKLCDIMGWC